MSTTTTVIKYGSTYQFNPVPQIGCKSNASPLGSSKSGPASREVVVTIVGRILGTSYNDIQTKWAALVAAFAKQDQTLYWNDGTTTRINQSAKVLSIDEPTEWGTYEKNYSITLKYIPIDDTNTAPFTVKYGNYTFSPIPIFGRSLKVQRETVDSIRGPNRWTLSLSGFIDKGSISANKTEYDNLINALDADDVFQYDSFIQSVKLEGSSVQEDTWQRRINYAITMQYSDGFTSMGTVIAFASSRTIGRVTDRVVRHYIPFLDGADLQDLGKNGQGITAVGYVIGTNMANARTAALTEINNQFPSPPSGVLMYEEESSKVVEKATENRVDWNVSRFYTMPVLVGGVYNS